MIALVFIICHGVRWIPNIYELIHSSHPDFDKPWPPWIDSVSNISHFFITLNSSVNFYIYYASQLKEFGRWIFCKYNANSTTVNRRLRCKTDKLSPVNSSILNSKENEVRVTFQETVELLPVVHSSK